MEGREGNEAESARNYVQTFLLALKQKKSPLLTKTKFDQLKTSKHLKGLEAFDTRKAVLMVGAGLKPIAGHPYDPFIAIMSSGGDLYIVMQQDMPSGMELRDFFDFLAFSGFPTELSSGSHCAVEEYLRHAIRNIPTETVVVDHSDKKESEV